MNPTVVEIPIDETTQVKVNTLSLEELEEDYNRYIQQQLMEVNEEKEIEVENLTFTQDDSFRIFSSKTGKEITADIFLANISQKLIQIPTNFKNPYSSDKFLGFKVLKRDAKFLEDRKLKMYTQLFWILKSLEITVVHVEEKNDIIHYLNLRLSNLNYSIHDFTQKLLQIIPLKEVPISI